MKTDILSEIVERKKEEVDKARKNMPENALREKAEQDIERRPFFERLERSGINIISEIKRASPSKGLICPDLDPAELAKEYEAGGAAALSVLTDETYFKGSFEDFAVARAAVSLPVLRKDFLISSYQVYESAVNKADAILLIARILSREQLKSYLELSGELGMDTLVEIHSREDIEAAGFAGARLIGINNRNLQSFETNIDRSVEMSAFLEPNQVAVAESGIRSGEDVKKLSKAGIHNFLIGESLVRSDGPKALLKSLISPE